MKINELLGEAVADTKDALALSSAIVDYIIANNLNVPGTKIDINQIPNLPKMLSQDGETLINATRLIVVDPVKIWGAENVGGDAASWYTDAQGNFVNQSPAMDARRSKAIRKGVGFDAKFWGIKPDDPEWRDLISARGKEGSKMNIRLPFNALSKANKIWISQTLSHEFSHLLDTIKGRYLGKEFEDVLKNKDARERLEKHKEALKLVTPENPNPEGLLSKAEEKQLIKILKVTPTQYAPHMSSGYFGRVTEINARLVESSHLLALWAPKMLQTQHNVEDIIKSALIQAKVAHSFVKWPDEAAFSKGLGYNLTEQQWKEAFANPEFQKVYKRIYKFMADESVGAGFIAQAQKDNFRSWTHVSAGGKSFKDRFLEKFRQIVINQVQLAKDTAQLAARQVKKEVQIVANSVAKIEQYIIKNMPTILAKAGVKSIPLVGILFGVAFAIPRLIKGDVPGAGLEVAGSVGSLITVIPTVAYQISRDVYGEVYQYEDGKNAVFEYDMAEDPAGTQQRVKELRDKITELLEKAVKLNAPKYPEAFQSTQGGAAVGNPMIARQAGKVRAQRDQSPVQDIPFESMLRIAGLR